MPDLRKKWKTLKRIFSGRKYYDLLPFRQSLHYLHDFRNDVKQSLQSVQSLEKIKAIRCDDRRRSELDMIKSELHRMLDFVTVAADIGRISTQIQ